MTERPIEPPSRVPAGDRRAVEWEAERYFLRHLLDALDALDEPEDLRAFFARLELDEFLARQAELPGGFEAGGRQIERHVLPATVRAGDWERFFRYLLTACSLRSLGRTLDDPTILRALTRSGRRPLAEALVGRLPEPAARARGWAVLAAACSPVDPTFQRLAEAFGTELDRIPGEADPEPAGALERWVDALETAGRALAPQLRARWSGWIDRLAADKAHADRVWIAVAEGFFNAGDPDAPELWEVLATVEDLEKLVRFLPERLARAEKGDPLRWLGPVRQRLPRAGRDPRFLWSIGLALVSLDQGDRGEGWRRLRSELPPAPWSAELLDRGAALWPRLADGDLDALAAELDDPERVARLRLLVLEGRSGLAEYRAVLALLADLDAGGEVLPLYLRALRAAPAEVEREVRSRVKGVLAHLSDLQYAVSSENLGRAFDLAARHLSRRRLRRTLDAACGAPGGNARTLRVAAEMAEEEGVLEELLERTETYAAMAAADAAEGFELRGDLLILLGCRMVERGAEPAILEQVAGRLLTEEEDRLRATAARVVARDARGSGLGDAERLCEGIRDPGLRLRVRLEILPADADPGDLVSPGRLYQIAARWPEVEDTLRTLSGLLPEPRQPARLAAEHFDGIERLGRRVEALTDLARHALAYQTRRYRSGRQDRLAAVLPLKEGLGVVESDDWLVSLTPELVSIGAHLGVREAVAEVQEAFERVSGLEAVSWERREAVLIETLGRIGGLFLGEEPAAALGNVAGSERRKRLRQLIVWLARLPAAAGETPVGKTLRLRWYRLLPVLTAIWERTERRALPGRRVLPALLLPSWWARSRKDPRSALETSARQAGRWTPEQTSVIDLCLAPPAERREAADRLLRVRRDEVEPEAVRALAWLLADEAPGRAAALLGRLEPGPERDRVVVEILRSAPVSGGDAGGLLDLLPAGTDPVRSWGAVWCGLRDRAAVDGAAWSSAVAGLVAFDRLDPADPRTIPVRRRLWTVEPEAGQSPPAAVRLAEAVRGALDTGGAAGGERAARLFLNAFVRPRLGQAASADAFERLRQMERAVERARRLESRSDGPAPDPEGSGEEGDSGAGGATPEGLLEKLRRWSRTWSRRSLRLDEHPLGKAPFVGFLFGLVGMAILPFFQMVLDAPDSRLPVSGEGVDLTLPGLGLLVLVLANALLIGGFLARSTPEEGTVRRSVRWLRTACASVPLFGLWTVPAWARLVTSVDWGSRQTEGRSVFVLPRGDRQPFEWGARLSASAHRLGRGGGRLGVLTVLFLANGPVLGEMARRLNRAGAHRGVMIVLLGFFHLVLFASMLASLTAWVRERRFLDWRRDALPVLSFCWLLPLPGAPWIGLTGLVLFDSDPARGSLSRTAYENVRGVRRFSAWLRLEGLLRRSWSRMRGLGRLQGVPESVRLKTRPSVRERKLLLLVQGKGMALFFEAAWLGGGLWTLASSEGWPSAEALGLVSSGLEMLLLAGGAGALLGLMVAFTREVLHPTTVARAFGPRFFWGHLLGAQMALLFGLTVGAAIARSELDLAGTALMVLGAGEVVLHGTGLFIRLLLRFAPTRPWETGTEVLLKVLLSAGVYGVGRDLAAGGAGAQDLIGMLDTFQLVAPLFGAVLGAGALCWLREEEGSGDFEGARSPRRRRFENILLTATAIAPFGGLAIPWWIWREERRGPFRGEAEVAPGQS